ncbi:MAG: BLUF domain-containing protein [Akkermansiaceae bacterium]
MMIPNGFKGGKSGRLKSAVMEASRADLSSMFRLAYVSEASVGFGPEDLRDICSKSAERNSLADITGILVMDRGKILQVLEGSKQSVESLFAKISRDPRHANISQVSGSEQSGRLLTTWSLVSGAGSSAPLSLLCEFHAMHSRMTAGEGLKDISEEEVELLKVIALFRAVPL